MGDFAAVLEGVTIRRGSGKRAKTIIENLDLQVQYGEILAVVGGSGGTGSDVASQLSLPRVMSFSVALSAFNIVTGTLLAGVIALIFNLIAKIVGGVGVGFTNNQ